MTEEKTRTPMISLIMPVKNGEEYIGAAIDSYRAQGWPNKELIVIDGHSTDRSREIVEDFKDPTIQLFQHKDMNATEALNFGGRIIRGEIVGLLMSDDWLEDGALEAVATKFLTHPDADLVNGGVRLVNEAGDRGLLENKTIAGANLNLDLDQILQTPHAAAFYFSRRLWNQLRGFDERYRYGGDRDFLMRCRLEGIQSQSVEAIVYNYRCHDGSDTFVDNNLVVKAYLQDHLQMTDLWLNSGKVSARDRKTLSAWRRNQAFELAARKLRIDGVLSACLFALKQCARDPIFVFTAITTTSRLVVRKLSRSMG